MTVIHHIPLDITCPPDTPIKRFVELKLFEFKQDVELRQFNIRLIPLLGKIESVQNGNLIAEKGDLLFFDDFTDIRFKKPFSLTQLIEQHNVTVTISNNHKNATIEV